MATKTLSHFKARPCDNKECKWHEEERIMRKECLCVDSDHSILSTIMEEGSIFMVGTFMCECSFHVRVEPVFEERE